MIMRIRNKHDGSVIDSSSIKEEAHLYRMTTLGNCNIFFKRDGWEEVDFVSKWHDLRNTPDDLPDTSRKVLCCVLSERYMEVLRYFSRFKKFVSGSETCCVEVIAWRELPKFNEK
jgi:hypothetical protein